MGGKNDFLGIAYIVVGGLCIILGFLFTVAHLIKPRYASFDMKKVMLTRLENWVTIHIFLGTMMSHHLLLQLVESQGDRLTLDFLTHQQNGVDERCINDGQQWSLVYLDILDILDSYQSEPMFQAGRVFSLDATQSLHVKVSTS